LVAVTGYLWVAKEKIETLLLASEMPVSIPRCSTVLLAAACVDESDHLTLVNAGDGEVVSQEEGEREGGAAGGEGGGCSTSCCAAQASAIAQAQAIAHGGVTVTAVFF